MTVMNTSFTLQSMAMYILTSWLSGYHTKIRQTLSAGRQPTRKTDGTEATFGSYLIKRYKAEASSVRTLQHFLSSFQICASGCMAAQNWSLTHSSASALLQLRQCILGSHLLGLRSTKNILMLQ